MQPQNTQDATTAETTDERKEVQVILDTGAWRWLIAITLLLALTAIGIWSEPGQTTPQAAGVAYGAAKAHINVLPDSGAQRHAMLKELKALGAKLDKINQTLTSGKVTVSVLESDTQSQSEGTSNATPAKR